MKFNIVSGGRAAEAGWEVFQIPNKTLLDQRVGRKERIPPSAAWS
jgi:hypothetical protein